MADKPYTGLTAKVKLGENSGAKVLAYISGFNLELTRDIIEILQFGAQYKEKVPAIKDWTGSVDGTVALAKDSTQKELFDAFQSGEPIVIGTYLDDKNYFEGSAIVSSFNMDGAPDDKINLTADFSGTGEVTLTLAEAGA